MSQDFLPAHRKAFERLNDKWHQFCWTTCTILVLRTFVIFYTLDLSETQNHHENKKTSWSCAGVNLPAKAWFDCGWIMWLASKHVLTERTNFAFLLH